MPSRTQAIQQVCTKMHKTHRIPFNKDETENLLKFYKHRLEQFSDKRSTKMTRTQFRDILSRYFDITDDIILDRVFKNFDADNDTEINMEEWVKGMSLFLRGGKEESLKFCFNCYDLNNDGHLSREEMFQLLKTCLVKGTMEEEQEEATKEFVEQTMKMMDADGDGRISFDDYRKSVTKDKLLLEFLGQCLPSDANKERFMQYVNSYEYEEQSLFQGFGYRTPQEL